MSASSVSATSCTERSASASRSTAVTRQPRCAKNLACRPCPQATSSTVAPAGTRCAQRSIHEETARVPCITVNLSMRLDFVFQRRECHVFDHARRQEFYETPQLALGCHDHL